MTTEESPRAKALSNRLHELFVEFEGDGPDQKLENIEALTRFLSSEVGGFNACAFSEKFGKGDELNLTQENFACIRQTSFTVYEALAYCVGNALLDPNLPYNKQWFYRSLQAATRLAFAKSRGLVLPDGSSDPELAAGLSDGLIACLASVVGVVALPESPDGEPAVTKLSEEVFDSYASDLEESIKSTVLRLQDKWGKYFAEKSASCPKKGR